MKTLFLLSPMILLLTGCPRSAEEKPGPADSAATVETVNLLHGLKATAQKGIMFGHQDDLAYGVDWVYPDGESDVRRVCTDYPAVYGMDLGGLELRSSHNLDSVPFSNHKTFVNEIYARGGITTFSWHARNPLTGGDTWDISSDKVVASVLPGGENHELYKEWLDRLAEFFNSLKDDDGNPVPVIFRPYHEHTGSWFWWGQKLCTAEEFVSLWKFTFDYLTETKNVHNLLFAYSSSGDIKNAEEFLERYPGDDYVDLMGFDYYQMAAAGNNSFTEAVSTKLGIITAVAAEHNKLAALTEAGYETIPDSTWWTAVLWPAIKDHKISYVLMWRNAIDRPNHFYAPYPGQVSADNFIEFYSLPGTIFQQELTAFNIYKRD
jgi:mannan endo-1,4-beta-mannosidase